MGSRQGKIRRGRVAGPVFLPEKGKRHIGAAPFAMHPSPVGHRPRSGGRPARRWEPQRLEPCLVEFVRYWPDHAGSTRPAQISAMAPWLSPRLSATDRCGSGSSLSNRRRSSNRAPSSSRSPRRWCKTPTVACGGRNDPTFRVAGRPPNSSKSQLARLPTPPGVYRIALSAAGGTLALIGIAAMQHE